MDDILVRAFHESFFEARNRPHELLKCVMFSTFAVKAIKEDP